MTPIIIGCDPREQHTQGAVSIASRRDGVVRRDGNGHAPPPSPGRYRLLRSRQAATLRTLQLSLVLASSTSRSATGPMIPPPT